MNQNKLILSVAGFLLAITLPMFVAVQAFAEDINWSKPGGQKLIPVGSQGASSRFTTTTGTKYAGQISFVPAVGMGGVSRRVWISETRGGEVLNQTYRKSSTVTGNRCEALGVQGSIEWSQSDTGGRTTCMLKPNTTYFVNYRNDNCSGICPLYSNIYTNGKAGGK